EYQPFPAELYDHGLHVVSAPVPYCGLNPAEVVRALGRPIVVMAKTNAIALGCLDAVLSNARGEVCGTTEGNLLGVRGGTLLPLPAWPEDVAREVVLELAKAAGIPTAETSVRTDELASLDEVFLAGTSCGVIAVVRVHGKDVGGGTEGPVTRT